MKKRYKSGWLLRQCEEAQKDVDSWPEWMKRVAYFDGTQGKPKEKFSTIGIIRC